MPYLNDEKETILNYNHQTKQWLAWSSIPSHIKKLEKNGWVKTKESKENGTVIDASFEAPKNAVTMRNITIKKSGKKDAFFTQKKHISQSVEQVVEEDV